MISHEWFYYIGGNCALKEKDQLGRVVARIEHVEQGVYEALLIRRNKDTVSGYFPLGTFNNDRDAIHTVEESLGL